MDEHELIRKMLPLAVADALESGELRRVQQHTHGCRDCRRELEIWSRYAQGLVQLPQPSVPTGLLQRTQIRMLQQKRAAREDCVNAAVLVAIAIFGWSTSFLMWALVGGLADGAVDIQGLNVVSPLSWSLVSAVLSWITTAASALVLIRRHEQRSNSL